MSSALLPSSLLDDRFLIEEEAGRGGMAVVFRATDLREQRKVAVKMLHPNTASPFVLAHFLREAEILATLRHPHIVSYVAHGRAPGGAAYLAIEWLEGESLAARLLRRAERLDAPVLRARLLAHPDNARILALGATGPELTAPQEEPVPPHDPPSPQAS